jgi:ankyrin repeat protein
MLSQDKQGNTALHLAARTHNVSTVSMLLQDGGAAAAHVKNTEGQLPLHVASKTNAWRVVAALLEADPSTATATDLRGLTAQQWAAKRGHEVCLLVHNALHVRQPSGILGPLMAWAGTCGCFAE